MTIPDSQEVPVVIKTERLSPIMEPDIMEPLWRAVGGSEQSHVLQPETQQNPMQTSANAPSLPTMSWGGGPTLFLMDAQFRENKLKRELPDDLHFQAMPQANSSTVHETNSSSSQRPQKRMRRLIPAKIGEKIDLDTGFSESLADIVIICSETQYYLHNLIVCPQSTFFDAIRLGQVELQQPRTLKVTEDPDIVRLVMNYLYIGRFSHTLAAEQPTTRNAYLTFVKMTDIAIRWGISRLQTLMQDEFIKLCFRGQGRRSEVDWEQFIAAVDFIWDQLGEQVEFKDAALHFLASDLQEFCHLGVIAPHKQLMQRNPEFGSDLVDYLSIALSPSDES